MFCLFSSKSFIVFSLILRCLIHFKFIFVYYVREYSYFIHLHVAIPVSQEAGKVVWYSHLFQNFPQFVVIHTIKGFSVVNKAEVDVFLEFPCFFYDPMVSNLISGSSAFSKSSLNILKFSVHILLKPSLENFEHYFASMWNECIVQWFGLNILWHCPSLGLEWKLIFSSPVATTEFSIFAGILSAALSQHHLLGFEIAQLEFHHLH